MSISAIGSSTPTQRYLTYLIADEVHVTLPHAKRGLRTPPGVRNHFTARPIDSQYRRHRADDFIEVVRGAGRRSANTVIMTVKAFAREPELLYVVLNYAFDSGVSVTMAPEHRSSQPATPSS